MSLLMCVHAQGMSCALTTVPLPNSTPPSNRKASPDAVLLHTVRVLLMDMLAADMTNTLLRFCSSALSAARRRERAAARVKAQQAAAAAAAAVETKGSAKKRRRGAAAVATDTSDSTAASGEDSKPASSNSTATTAAAAAGDGTDDDTDTDTAVVELTGLAAEEARERARAAAAFFGLDKLNARALAHLFTAAGRGLSGAEAAALAWHGLNAGLSFDDLPEPPAWSGQLLQLACSKGQKREPKRRSSGGVQAASS
jgi:hypothetical protein